MTSKGQTLIFFSLHYPFDFSDSYLDEEIKQLAQHFDRVFIISMNTTSPGQRKTPPNSRTYRFSPFEQRAFFLKSITLLFRPFFYAELYKLFFKYKQGLTRALITELFAFYTRALLIEDFINQVIRENSIESKGLLFYTYWMQESTLAAAFFKKRDKQIKIISRAHSLDVYFFRSSVNYWPYKKFVLHHLEHLFFISSNAKKYFIEKHFIDKNEINKLSVARIGIPGPGVFINKPASSKISIISVAFIQKLKRLELAIEALSHVDEAEIEWYHVGHCEYSDHYFEEIKNYAASKLSIKPNIKYHFVGHYTKEQLWELYNRVQFDLFLNTSETEGIPVSMMEALSYSVPLMGTNVGGVSEIIENDINGYLLSPNPTGEEIGKAITYYAQLSTEKRVEMRQKAFNTWDNKFNYERNNRVFVETVTKLIA